MGAAEDIVKAKMKKPSMGYAESVKVAEANTPPEKPKPPPTVPVEQENWVQKMTRQIHRYLTRKAKESKTNADPNTVR
jgi:hypothetical protein